VTLERVSVHFKNLYNPEMAGESKEQDSIGELCSQIQKLALTRDENEIKKLREELKTKFNDLAKTYGREDAWDRVRSLVCIEYEKDNKWQLMLNVMAPLLGKGLSTEYQVNYFPASMLDKHKR